MIVSKKHIPELPYESLIKSVCGSQWRGFPEEERNGALGVAIVKSVLDGLRPELGEISSHLGVDRETLRGAYKNLSMNGTFRHDQIRKDAKALNGRDLFAWRFYAGHASGFIGPWRPFK